MRFLNTVVLCCLLVLSCGCGVQNRTLVNRGDVVHPFKKGKMQCLSQITPDGETVILLKSLSKNTSLEFKGVVPSGDSYVVSVMMRVVADDDICLLWVDVQPVSIKIDPEPVESITLVGKQIFAEGKVTVLIEESFNQ